MSGLEAIIEQAMDRLLGERHGQVIDTAKEWRDSGHIDDETFKAICAFVLIGTEPIPAEVMQHFQRLHEAPIESADAIRARIGDSRDNLVPRSARALAAALDASQAAVGAGLDTETPVDPSIEHEMPVAPRDVSSSIKATARVTEVRRRDG